MKPIELNGAIPPSTQMESQLADMDRAIQNETLFTRKKQAKLVDLINKIPFLKSFLEGLDKTEKAVKSIDKIDHTPILDTLSHDLHIVGPMLKLVDFLRIPVIYLSAFILKEQLPFSLSKGLEFSYSAALISLSIMSLTVPAAAVPIGIATAAFGLSVGVATLAKSIILNHRLNKELKKITADIKVLNETLETQIEEVKRLEATGDRIALSRATSAFNTNMQKRKELYQLQDEKKCRLNKHSTKNIMNKSVGIILSSLGFSGLIVSLFIPPVGLTIMAASAIAGAAYFVFKITPPLVNWISHTFKTIFGGHAKENGHVDDQNHLEGPSLTETLEEEPVAPTLNVSNSANSITSEVAMPGTPGTDTAEIMTILAVQPGAHKPNPIPSALEDDEREELLTEGNTPPRNPSTTPIAVETETVPNRPENEAICPTSGPRNEE